MKNIGGSILPSSCPQILEPLPFRGGVLRVVPDEAVDTHRLTFNGGTIASHPNGYSCHALAERMIAGEAKRTDAQASYIVACGGSVEWAALKAATTGNKMVTAENGEK
jgi:hypothetical protein